LLRRGVLPRVPGDLPLFLRAVAVTAGRPFCSGPETWPVHSRC